MDKYTATEEAYKHGYEKGYEAGKKDSVEVVRCKDCEWYNTANCAYGFGWCDHFDIGMFDNDFCSHGSKKELPEITEQTMDALNKMGAAVHGGIK